MYLRCITGSPSSKYEHRRASALLRNIQNIRICIGKKPIVSVTYENERISIENSLPYLKCVLRLSCVVHGPIYGRFMGFYVNGFLSILGIPIDRVPTRKSCVFCLGIKFLFFPFDRFLVPSCCKDYFLEKFSDSVWWLYKPAM